MSRALRRHHRARITKRVIRILNYWFDEPVDRSHPWVNRRVSSGMSLCSCHMCCNVRRSKGWQAPERTRQERLSDLDLREWLDSLGDFD